MVTDLIRFSAVIERANKEQLPANVIASLKKLGHEIMSERKRKRQPRPPAPAGGISIRAASRKYGIATTTIYQWVIKNYIPLIPSESKYEKFIDESRIALLARIHHGNPGRGSWAVRNFILQEQNS